MNALYLVMIKLYQNNNLANKPSHKDLLNLIYHLADGVRTEQDISIFIKQHLVHK